MEFVIVRFPRSRSVIMDNAPAGNTNTRLPVQAGTHVFDLDVPDDYTPPSQTVQVIGTTPQQPMDVVFTEKPSLAKVPGKKKKAAKRKTTKRKVAAPKTTKPPAGRGRKTSARKRSAKR